MFNFKKYHKKYYKTHRKKILSMRKVRYAKDREYRKAILERSRKKYKEFTASLRKKEKRNE